MATILFSSDTAPLSSVIIWCTVVATLNMSSKDELFTGGAWTDWPGFCALVNLYTCVGWLYCDCCVCWGMPRSATAKDCPGTICLGENTLPVDSFCCFWGFIRSISSLAWLQPRYVEGCGRSLSFSLQLQQFGEEFSVSFSGQSLCRWSRPHHKQRGDCLQFAQTWPNSWHL
jgi:hypothetical protein